jgi:hypothetical protein
VPANETLQTVFQHVPANETYPKQVKANYHKILQNSFQDI